MRNLIKKILKEENQKVRRPEVGDIYRSEYAYPNTLVLIDSIINKNDAGPKILSTVKGNVTIDHDGYYLNYKATRDGGKTWEYQDGDPYYYTPVKWIEHIIKRGDWILELPNIDFFGQLKEDEDNQFDWVEKEEEFLPDDKAIMIWLEDLTLEEVGRVFQFLRDYDRDGKKWLLKSMMGREDWEEIKRKASILTLYPNYGLSNVNGPGMVSIQTHREGETKKDEWDVVLRSSEDDVLILDPREILKIY